MTTTDGAIPNAHLMRAALHMKESDQGFESVADHPDRKRYLDSLIDQFRVTD